MYGWDQRKILLLASRIPRQREDTYGTRSITIPPPYREDGQTSCGHSVLCKGNGRHLARRFSLRVFSSTASSSPEQHHTYDFFTEVWSGESWLQGEDAIDAICHPALIATEDITSERFALAPVEEPGGAGLGTESVFETPLELVLSRLSKSFRAGTGFSAHCPAHNDTSPSLSINEGEDGRVLMHCHAGCDLDDILAKLEFTKSDLFSDSGQNSGLMLRQMRPATNSGSMQCYQMEDLHRNLLKETPEIRLEEHAVALSVSLESLRDLVVVWSPEHTCWLFPGHN